MARRPDFEKSPLTLFAKCQWVSPSHIKWEKKKKILILILDTLQWLHCYYYSLPFILLSNFHMISLAFWALKSIWCLYPGIFKKCFFWCSWLHIIPLGPATFWSILPHSIERTHVLFVLFFSLHTLHFHRKSSVWQIAEAMWLLLKYGPCTSPRKEKWPMINWGVFVQNSEEAGREVKV